MTFEKPIYDVNEYLIRTYYSDDFNGVHRYKAYTGDGIKLSIQASELHACYPRKTFEGPYDEIQLGYFSSLDESFKMELDEYARDPKKSPMTTFEFVPTELVNKFLVVHKGILGTL